MLLFLLLLLLLTSSSSPPCPVRLVVVVVVSASSFALASVDGGVEDAQEAQNLGWCSWVFLGENRLPEMVFDVQD